MKTLQGSVVIVVAFSLLSCGFFGALTPAPREHARDPGSQAYDPDAPGPVTDLTATAGDGEIVLAWVNPEDEDFEGVIVRHMDGVSPAGPTDGTQIYAGAETTFTHTELTNGTTYYYTVFAHDGVPNYSTGAEAQATVGQTDSIPPEVMEQIIIARQYIGYFQTGYYLLIVFMVLLAAGIVLINRNVRDATRVLGIVLLVYGVLELAAFFYARNLVPPSLPLHDLPASLQPWVLGVYGDLLAPLQILGLVVLVAGAVLLVVSFVYRPRRAED